MDRFQEGFYQIYEEQLSRITSYMQLDRLQYK
jgi:hypothetical protein